MISIIISTYLIYLCTTMLDTPFVYAARKIRAKYGPKGDPETC